MPRQSAFLRRSNMKYKIVTYGCQMNEHDSERIAYLLENMGYQPTEEKNEADFILYNTCLVRENAELKVYGQIGTYKKWKEENPDKILAISGCMMQTGPARDIIKECTHRLIWSSVLAISQNCPSFWLDTKKQGREYLISRLMKTTS